MSNDGASASAEPRAEDGEKPARGGMLFISVAFVTAVTMGPVVIATGLLTSHFHAKTTWSGLSSSPLRQSLDGVAPAPLRPSEN